MRKPILCPPDSQSSDLSNERQTLDRSILLLE
jgi:hypothetical protein